MKLTIKSLTKLLLILAAFLVCPSVAAIEGCINVDGGGACTACDQKNYSIPNDDGSACHPKLPYCTKYQ